MFQGLLQKTAPHRFLCGCGQRLLFAGIRFQVIETIGRGIELEHEFVTGFSHRQHARSHTILFLKRVGAARNAFGDGCLVSKNTLPYLCPGTASAKRRRDQ